MDDFRRFFLRGLGALVPTLLTFAILVWVYGFINENIGVHITRGLLSFCSWISAEPAPGIVDEEKDPLIYGTPIDEWDESGRRLTIEHRVVHHPALRLHDPADRQTALDARNDALWQIAFRKYKLHLLGFLIAIVLVYFTGFFLASFIGRTTWRATEGLLARIPLIRAIYPHVKQVTDFLLSERPVEFSGVVAVQFPRPGVWSLGLSTGGPILRLQQEFPGKELVTVFIPTSPTPFTGSVIQVPRDEVIGLNMTIDEGLRFMISGGVIKPEAELSGPRLPEHQATGD
ncbi:MAG: DUF502 domain-containing protein [Planctomycetes bacterium]|nr:DUF502 domain-containing protein [Planctomycetota bacterium]